MTILDALADPQLFGAAFRETGSWQGVASLLGRLRARNDRCPVAVAAVVVED